VTGIHRYQLTNAGRMATSAILTALRSSVRVNSPTQQRHETMVHHDDFRRLCITQAG
jgi:hypothetical protein